MENCLTDLYDNPDFIHKIMEKFTQIHEYEIRRYDELNVFDTDPYYIHCTPACTFDLPVKNMDAERVTSKDVWCRAMAQPLAVVSPEMFKEFDLDYTERLFAMCGLSYYGCCEPLSDKIELLRRFPNLRRISITPWADADAAAEKIGGNYVLSYKSNPAYVGEAIFHPEPVIAETTRVLEACRKNNTPCEFIIKDISTVANHPENLTKWVETVNSVIDRYY
jgi:uroporphyrinogen-III decarboxylase